MSILNYDLSPELDSAQSIERVQYVVGQMTVNLGFDHWHYQRSSYENYARPELTVLGNLPAAWEKRVQIEEPPRRGADMLKDHVNGGYLPSPYMWGIADSVSIEAPLPTSETIATSGWSQIVRGSNGASIGKFSLVRTSKELTHKEVIRKQTDIYWLAYAVHDKVTKLQTLPLQISAIEREIMRWTADGKSTAEIASILQIKERTVTFRINNVVNRLGVQNKTAAAVRLAVGGMLF
jgi:LuxR family transcriptional regulator, quorum-sensing system regulator SolR